MYFFRVLILLNIIFFTSSANAACEDIPTNEVDWTNCNFVDQTDLSGVSLAGANMAGVNLSLVNLEKSQLNNADMSFGNFVLGNFSGTPTLSNIFLTKVVLLYNLFDISDIVSPFK